MKTGLKADGCKFCSLEVGEAKDIQAIGRVRVSIRPILMRRATKTKWLFVSTLSKDALMQSQYIRFCPFCVRKLKEK